MPFFSKPKYSTVTVKKDIPKGLWHKCPLSGDLVYAKDLENNQMVVPKSGYHFPITAPARIRSFLDEGTFVEEDANLTSVDPLGFQDSLPYPERIKKSQQKSGLKDAVVCGTGKLHGMAVSLAVMDFRFIGASMGSVVGEKITRTMERSLEKKIPCLVFCASGGARMQEGILSLMQMAKTSAALGRLHQRKIPYVSILTNPTYAGVSASFATLGDLIISEPGCMIGFAGARVIRETTNEDLPEGFQTAEFLLERGLIDQIVPRTQLRDRIAFFLEAFGSKA